MANVQDPSELPPDTADETCGKMTKQTCDTEGDDGIRETSSQAGPDAGKTQNIPWERKRKTSAYKHKIGSNNAVQLKGPNAKAKASVSVQRFESMARAEVGRVKFQAKPDQKDITADVRAGVGAYANVNAGFNMDVSCNIGNGVLDIIDNFDRDPNAYARGTYAESGTYAFAFNNKPGERVPKAGAYACAGVGHARAEFSVFEAEAKGPNAGAGAHANVLGAEAMARAEIGSASASAGPLQVRAALGVDTGVRVGAEGLELKVLGTGFNIGERPSVSILGSEISCCIL